MRIKILVGFGLAVLLVLSACSPGMLDKFGDVQIFGQTILVRPTATLTVQATALIPATTVPEAVEASLTQEPTQTPTSKVMPSSTLQSSRTPTLTQTLTATITPSPTEKVQTPTSTATQNPPTALPAELPTTATSQATSIQTTPVATLPAEVLSGLAHELKTNQSNLELSELQSINWPDACFDFPRGDHPVCAQVITPGYQGNVTINLKTFGGDPEYAFSSDATGKIIYTLPRAALSARDALSTSTGIDPETIKFILVEKWDWPNTCAMTPTPLPKGAICVQVPLPGWRVVLNANGTIYEYHTDLNGQVIQAVVS